MHFPYVLTKKYGLSKELMELVHEGMLSPHGLSSTVDNIKRRREKRYYKSLCLFADKVRQHRLSNPLYLAPTPPPAADYCAKQSPIGPETLSAAWLPDSRIYSAYSALCEQVMKCAEVKKALRMDHSVKFCKRLKVWSGGTGKRESMTDAKMLLLLQNEIGQIVGRRLTRSENSDETRELLEHVKKAVPGEEDGSQHFVISDNANALRKMVNDVFGTRVGVRQDPFHVVQRFTEKVKDKTAKKQLAKRLHEAIYAVDGELRLPTEAAARVRAAVTAVSLRDVNCSEAEWTGSLSSNIQQIECGDLYVESNTYEEGGGKSVRVLSTSQLEGFHSALKKLLARSESAEVGLRILDVFILHHNLKVGSRYGRNPPLEHSDVLAVAQAASMCRGIIAESPQLEFVSKLMSAQLSPPQYRSITEHDFGFERWTQLFENAQVDTRALELKLHRSQQHSTSIKELLSKQAVFATTSRVPKAVFFNSLCLSELDYEAAVGFSSQELALLKQLRNEQVKAARSWDKCALVTTIMYNIVVASTTNQQLKLRRRSYATLISKIDSITKHESVKSAQNIVVAEPQKLFRFPSSQPSNDDLTGHEQAFQIDLFDTLRQMNGVRKKRQVFLQVYDFASCVCNGILRKSPSSLLTRWENMKRASNRGSTLKIKLKIPPEMLTKARGECSTSSLTHSGCRDRYSSEATNGDGVETPQLVVGQHRAATEGTQAFQFPALSSDGDTSIGAVVPMPSQTTSIRPAIAPNFPQIAQEDANPSVVSSPIAQPSSSPAPESTEASKQPVLIAQEHIDQLRALEAELPNRNGKWDLIYHQYSTLYPDAASRISINALRCRLKIGNTPKKAKLASLAEVPEPVSTSRKRKETSCSSWKKRCGDLTANPHCLRAADVLAMV